MLRKIFVAIIFIFTTSCFAEELNGFLGIPFGTEKVETWKQMRAKGWNCCDESESENGIESSLCFDDRQYAGKNVNFIRLSFKNNNFDSVAIYFDKDENISPVFKALLKKYKFVTIKPNAFYETADKKCTLLYLERAKLIKISVSKISSIESDI